MSAMFHLFAMIHFLSVPSLNFDGSEENYHKLELFTKK